MINRFEVNEQYTKTYKTVENLNKALTEYNYLKFKHILVYTASGRVTAVFVDKNANEVIFNGFNWVMG